MNPGFVHIVKTLSTIVGTTVLVGGLAVSLVLWFSRVQTQQDSRRDHEEIKSEFRAADKLLEIKTDNTAIMMSEISRDVRTIKCLILAPNTKARMRCGLE